MGYGNLGARDGRIAGGEILFHHQNRDFQKQAIRDTFPYFLGAQNADALRKREELTELRRAVRRQRLRLEEARAVRDAGVGRAAGLVAEARASGLLSTDTMPINAGEAFELLSAVLAGDAPAAVVRRHPASPAAWAALAQQAQEAGADDVTVYAYARVGYHRSLDMLRRNGWKGHGPVPWEHEPNRGFLRSLALLALAARAIGETEEWER